MLRLCLQVLGVRKPSLLLRFSVKLATSFEIFIHTDFLLCEKNGISEKERKIDTVSMVAVTNFWFILINNSD